MHRLTRTSIIIAIFAAILAAHPLVAEPKPSPQPTSRADSKTKGGKLDREKQKTEATKDEGSAKTKAAAGSNQQLRRTGNVEGDGGRKGRGVLEGDGGRKANEGVIRGGRQRSGIVEGDGGRSATGIANGDGGRQVTTGKAAKPKLTPTPRPSSRE